MGVTCSRANGEELEDLPLHMQVEHVLSIGRSRGTVGNPAERALQSQVRLNIYDTRKRDGYSMHPVSLSWSAPSRADHGFHCGVEVYSCEWSYGGEERQWGLDWNLKSQAHPTGITCSVPRDSPGHAYCEYVLLGKTLLSEEEVLRTVQKLGKAWVAADYDPVKRSCLHFSETLSQALGLGNLPDQVKRLACEEQDLVSRPGWGITCCGHSLCAYHPGGPTDPPVSGSEVLVLRRQLEQATYQLNRAQHELARERSYHDDAIRQVLELRRSGSTSESQSCSPRTPSASPRTPKELMAVITP